MPFLPLFTGIRHLAHVLTVTRTKACLLCATPAGMDLYIYRPCLQALTECSPLDFRSSSITTPCLLQHRCRFILTAPARLSRFLAVNLISDRNDATCCTCSRFVSCAAPTVLATSVARTGRAVQFSTDSHGIHHPRLLTTTMNGLRQSCAFAQHT